MGRGKAIGAVTVVTLVGTWLVPACSDFESTDASSTDAGSEAGGGPRVMCRGTLCAGGEVCCITYAGGEVTAGACTTKAACPSPLPYYDCDETADCAPGNVCCATTNGGSYDWPEAHCKPACTGSQRQLCAQSSECADAGSCTLNNPSLDPVGLSACSP